MIAPTAGETTTSILPNAARAFSASALHKPLGARRVHEHGVLLEEHRRVQAGGEDEMPLQQRAGGAEFVEHLVLIHGAL